MKRSLAQAEVLRVSLGNSFHITCSEPATAGDGSRTPCDSGELKPHPDLTDDAWPFALKVESSFSQDLDDF